METDFIKPRFDYGGFSSLPQRIAEHLSADQYDAVVLFLIDGFGWRFFEKYQELPFFKQTSRLGTVSKLISQFPSTTAAQLTTIHTGLPVGEHGIFEWYYYDPMPDQVIAPLLFSFAGTSRRDSLKPSGFKPSGLYPATNFYRLLKDKGIASNIFQLHEYSQSTYSNTVGKGAKAIGYRTLPEALVNLADKLSEIKPPAYFFFYFDMIDATSHEYGPESTQTEAEILAFLLAMEHIFLKALAGEHKKILFLLTADHGQVEIDPRTTIYLNREPAFAGIERFLKTNLIEELIVPAGSARDFFLYIKPELLDEAQLFLASRLDGRAEVRRIIELAQAGYFGPVISPQFLARAGDLVILPHNGESVWWFEKDRFEQKFRGHHGGLTKQEMEIPLITWEM